MLSSLSLVVITRLFNFCSHVADLNCCESQQFQMSQFSLENEIRTATRMDSSLTKGPWQRQRKALENSNSSLNASGKLSFSGGGGGLKRLSESLTRKTPSKTPRRSPSRAGTPSRDGAGTPGRKTPGGGDRFIPNRSSTDYEVSHFKILREVS